MPSTYTLNNGIELIGTGEQSGTWGDTTNTNFELLDTALDGQVSVTLAATGSSGSPNTLPISDGASSNGRNRLVIFGDGGDLGGTAFVQLTPNDSEKIIYVRNNLSGSRSILLFQGTYSASNDYEVPAGTTAVVFFNGAGTGAVAANVFNNAYFDGLRLGSVSVTAILDEDNMASDSATALATQQSIKAYVDTQVGANNELSEVLANGNTTGGTDIAVSANDDITFTDSSKAIFGAGSDLQIYHDGSNSYVKDNGTGDLYLQGTANVRITNTSGQKMFLGQDGGETQLYYSGVEKLATTSTGVDITGTVTADAYALDSIALPSAGTATIFNRNTDNNLYIQTDSGNTVYLLDGSQNTMYAVSPTSHIFQISNSEKMRISSDGSVGIGTSSPSQKLHVEGAGNQFILLNNSTTNDGFYLKAGTGASSIQTAGGSHVMNFFTGGAERMRISSSGNVGIGNLGNAATLLHIGSTGTPEFRVQDLDASGGYLSITHNAGTSTISADPSNSSGSPTLVFKTVNSEAMRIDSSGNVGIGCSPASGVRLDIRSNATTTLGDFRNASATGFGLYVAAGDTSSQYAFRAADYQNNSLFSVMGDGNVGIGRTPSSVLLDVQGSTSDTFTAARFRNRGQVVGSAVKAVWSLNRDGSDVDYEAGVISVHKTQNWTTAPSSIDSYMAFSTNNAESVGERMRIDSSGNLLVGKTATDLDVAGSAMFSTGQAYHTRSNDTALYLNRLTSDGTIIDFRKDGSTVGSIGNYGANVYFAQASKGVGVSSGRIYPSTQTGTVADNSMDLGNSDARWLDLYLSGGVYLGGTGSANKLDDYEEGTWTPTFGGDGGNPTISYTFQNGDYTKVGRIVHVRVHLEISGTASGGSGGLYIGGLPFTSANDGYVAGTVSYKAGWDTNAAPTMCLVSPNTTRIPLYLSTSADPRNASTRSQVSHLGTNTQIYLAVSYNV